MADAQFAYRADLMLAAYAVTLGYTLCRPEGDPISEADFLGGIPPFDLRFHYGKAQVWSPSGGLWLLSTGKSKHSYGGEFARLEEALLRGAQYINGG